MINNSKLETLAEQNPSLIKTKDNHYTLRIQGQYVHSYYSCEKEANRLVEQILPLDKEKTLIIIIGSGLGYHIEILERAGFNNLIIIEKNMEIFSIFKNIYKLKKNYYVISPEDDASRLDTIFSLFELQKLTHIKTVILRGCYKKELYVSFEDRIERLLKVKLGDFATRLRFEEIWFINIIKNISNLKSSFFVNQLFNTVRNIPILIISAGPSLKYSLKNIENIYKYCFIIAVDTALIPLYEAGIIPDFVYSLDSQIHNLKDFCLIDHDYLRKTRLIYDVVVNPRLPDFFKSINQTGSIKSFAANTAHMDIDYNGHSFLVKNDLVNWMETTGGFRIGDIETGGSVSTSAFYFAYLMGGNPIILAGQDLAYTYYCSHSPSTSHYYQMIHSSSRMNPLQSIFLNILLSRKYMPVQSLYPVQNETLYTDFVLNNFRGWFEESAASVLKFNPDIHLINSTYQGAFLNYFVSENLDDHFTKNNYSILDKEKLFNFQLIDFHKIDNMISQLKLIYDYMKSLDVNPSFFQSIEQSEWKFLQKYFMREMLIYERYENFDKFNIERKLFRFIKSIEGVFYDKH